MAYNFLRGDRDQPFLLPPDLRDWLPQDHIAWFILDVTDQVDLQPFYRAHRDDGHGHRAYDPKTLLGVLLYGYCIGVRSSRQIERRLNEDIAFRVLAANQTPDHATIARFRVRHEQALARFLVESLKLCAAAGMVRSASWRWMARRWPPTPPTRPTAPSTSSSARSPRSWPRRPPPTRPRTASTAQPAATSCPPSWPARPDGWPGCGRPRPGWKPRRPNASSATSSGWRSWPPRPGPAASSPRHTTGRGAVTRRPTPRRPRT